MSTPPINITQQRSLSIYTLIGALQSILWFFYLPTISKAYWSQLFGRYTNQQAEIILWAIGFPFFLLYILVAALPSYFLFCDWEFIQQYKISKDPWPWAIVANNNIGRSIRSKISDNDKQQFLRRTYKSILSDFAGLLVLIPSLVYICYQSIEFNDILSQIRRLNTLLFNQNYITASSRNVLFNK
jgi:hypothetical protein